MPIRFPHSPKIAGGFPAARAIGANRAGAKRATGRARRGFTLLELFLTLAVVLALSALVLPNVFSILGNRQLVRGAEGLRNAIVDARVEAMRTGRPQMLRVQLDGSAFALQPMYSLSDVTEAGDQMGQGTVAAMGGTASAGPMQQTQPPPLPSPGQDGSTDPLGDRLDSDQLPEGVVFAGVQVVATARSATAAQGGNSAMPGAAPVAPTPNPNGWSEPIIFYADGTTSNALITVARESSGRIVLRLRGLTGETQLSGVMP